MQITLTLVASYLIEIKQILESIQYDGKVNVLSNIQANCLDEDRADIGSMAFRYFQHLELSSVQILKIRLILSINQMVKQLLIVISLIFSTCCQDQHTDEEVHLNKAQIWGFGIMAGIAISLIGFVAAIILVVVKKFCKEVYFENFIKFLFSLSCGALIGDAIIHILAQSYENQQTNKRIVSLIFIASIVFFMIIDRLLHAFGVAHSHWVGQKCVDLKQNHDHHHHHLGNEHKHMHNQEGHECDHEAHAHNHRGGKHASKHSQQPLESALKIDIQENAGSQIVDGSKKQIQGQSDGKRQSKIDENIQQKKSHQKACCCYSFAGKGSAGYMNIMGSFIHNFFDGLALGIAFATGNPLQFVPVLVAIIAHEIPRQLGDVAILLKSQFSSAQTVICNGSVNFLSLIGVVIGLAIVNMSSLVKLYIMVFVAGNFIYIAADIWQHVMKNHNKDCKKKNVLEFIGLSIGVGAMFLLTLMETESSHQH